MIIVAHLSRDGVPIADVTYRSGLHVEVRVAKDFLDEEISFPLKYSQNGELKGTWEEALDCYFNEGRFDAKGYLFPGEMPRIGNARDHKTLFRQAAHSLWKDLEKHGYRVEVEFV